MLTAEKKFTVNLKADRNAMRSITGMRSNLYTVICSNYLFQYRTAKRARISRGQLRALLQGAKNTLYTLRANYLPPAYIRTQESVDIQRQFNAALRFMERFDKHVGLVS